jgi:hypothetical protein
VVRGALAAKLNQDRHTPKFVKPTEQLKRKSCGEYALPLSVLAK